MKSEMTEITLEILGRAIRKIKRKPQQWPKTIWFVDMPDVLRCLMSQVPHAEPEMPLTFWGIEVRLRHAENIADWVAPLNAPGVYVQFSDGAMKKIMSNALESL